MWIYSVVFLHGWRGKRTKTWLAAGAATPWPQELLSKKIPEARIISFGYNADIVHFTREAGQNTVREHARNLVSDLTDVRRRTFSSSLPLIFVAHSMGGLVCEQVWLYLMAPTWILDISCMSKLWLGNSIVKWNFWSRASALSLLICCYVYRNTTRWLWSGQICPSTGLYRQVELSEETQPKQYCCARKGLGSLGGYTRVF